VWQQQWAELYVDRKILAMYKDEEKEEHVITYNFDLEKTEMIIPQVRTLLCNNQLLCVPTAVPDVE
jgi:hypothetical protein